MCTGKEPLGIETEEEIRLIPGRGLFSNIDAQYSIPYALEL